MEFLLLQSSWDLEQWLEAVNLLEIDVKLEKVSLLSQFHLQSKRHASHIRSLVRQLENQFKKLLSTPKIKKKPNQTKEEEINKKLDSIFEEAESKK